MQPCTTIIESYERRRLANIGPAVRGSISAQASYYSLENF